MTLQLRHLRLRANTNDGEFGADVPFRSGLNVLAAPNTSGKSTCVQAILYALGLEGMLGPAKETPLPHAMTDYLEDEDGVERTVIRSYVMVELLDDEGRPITVRRYVRHPEIDSKLISTWDLTVADLDSGDPGERRDFYVRRRGAAQREAGFHHYLAERIGWDLPRVPQFSGGLVPLYLETIAPLWFVEQKRGWSSIQAQTPTHLQIRDVKRRALEFTLALDSQADATLLESLVASQQEIVASWATVAAEAGVSAAGLGVSIADLPTRPTRDWPSLAPPRLQIPQADDWNTLDFELERVRRDLDALSGEIPAASDTSTQEQTQLVEAMLELQRLEVSTRENSQQLELEEATATDASARLDAVEEDILRHRDLIVLRQMGSDVVQLDQGEHCPTCRKPLEGVLLNPEDAPEVLAAEVSVQVLQQQRDLLVSLLADSQRVVAARRSKTTALRSTARDLRSSIRALKDSLAGPSTAPSVASIEKRLTLEGRAAALEMLRDDWLARLDRFDDLSGRWSEVTDRLTALRSQDRSAADREKLSYLEQGFARRLGVYGFTSCPVDQVILSHDDYMPTHEGFELSLDFSASDGIRVIWAYLLSLLDTGSRFETNHPGLLVFDEPRQQAAAELSFAALLRTSHEVANPHSQVLFATSEPPASLEALLTGIPATVVAFDSKILRRLPLK